MGVTTKLQLNEVMQASKNSRTWTVNWFAPSSFSDSVVFYFAGNTVDGDGSPSGDDPTEPQVKVVFKQKTAVEENVNSITQNFQLHQNYPNPFNPTTVISYQLPVTGRVELAIYNINGQVIETIIYEQQQAGIYHYEWNGSFLMSGIYFYQIKVRSEDGKQNSQIKKMTLLR